MKRFINLFLILALVVVGFSSCDEKEDVPGGIPGMGNTPGDLEIKETFTAPEGIEITLQSEDEATLESALSTQSQLKSTNGRWRVRGCGGSMQGNNLKLWVKVKLTIQNTSNIQRCFELPTGTVFKVSDQDYQNGIVVSPVSICVDAHGWCDFSLILMCVNKGRDGSSANVSYELTGVTASHQMWVLLNLLRNKKCNIGFYSGDDSPSAGLKSANALDLEKYKEVADQIQNAIWAITNGDGLSQDQIDYMKNLPDVE